MKNTKDSPMNRNPMAKAVKTTVFRPRVVKSKKVYTRKIKTKGE